MTKWGAALLVNAAFWLGLAQLPAHWIIAILAIPGAALWFCAMCIIGGLLGDDG